MGFSDGVPISEKEERKDSTDEEFSLKDFGIFFVSLVFKLTFLLVLLFVLSFLLGSLFRILFVSKYFWITYLFFFVFASIQYFKETRKSSKGSQKTVWFVFSFLQFFLFVFFLASYYLK